MSTFTDRYFQRGHSWPRVMSRAPSIIAHYDAAFQKAETIVAHNVSDYFFSKMDWREMDFPEDLPSIVPPFPTCVVECRRLPLELRTEQEREPMSRYPETWGVLFETTKLKYVLGTDLSRLGVNKEAFLTLLRRVFVDADQKAWVDDNKVEFVSLQVKLHDKSPLCQEVQGTEMFDLGELWFVSSNLFCDPYPLLLDRKRNPPPEGSIVGPLGGWCFLLDKYGYPVGDPSFNMPVASEWWEGITATDEEIERIKLSIIDDLQRTTVHFYMPAFLAIAFTHCKNVEMTDNVAPRHERRQADREKRKAPVSYKTLVIEPMKKVLRHEGGADATGIKQALHICRGHFKDYRSSGKGLFGKYKGLYWWDSHLAGKPEHGTIVKDYDEKAPTT